MNGNLLHCLKQIYLVHFQNLIFKTCKDREIMVEIFCTCRVPWRKAENNIYAKQIVGAVDTVNGFTESMNEYQKIFFREKTLRLNDSAEVLKVKLQFSRHVIRRSEHCLSVKGTAKNVEIGKIFFFCIYSLRLKVQKFTGVQPVYSRALSFRVHSTLLGKWNLWNRYIWNSFI